MNSKKDSKNSHLKQKSTSALDPFPIVIQTVPKPPINSKPLIIIQGGGQAVFAFKEEQEKVIPGYNFQSLFRKKSHIRLARKRSKLQSQRRNPALKQEPELSEQKNILKGHWSSEQNKYYHWFLQLHSGHFIQKHMRRTDKIFKSMALFISTRQAEQCRSHHQKMEKKYHSFYRIIEKLRMQYFGTLRP